jgi:DtxR family Mn-dependent transcriptional regulator
MKLPATLRDQMLTQAMESYLKTIFEILESEDRATTSAIADQMNIASASVTAMLKKLARLKLITYEPYQGVRLTEVGEKTVLEIVRHHRLLELYLAQALNMPWDRVHEEAEKLDHVLSEELEERIAEALGDPAVDPHGSPIPTRDGTIRRVDARCLSSVNVGETVTVVEVSDRDPELLRYLGDLGMLPGTVVTVLAVEPFEGPLVLQANAKEFILGKGAARMIRVSNSAQNSKES